MIDKGQISSIKSSGRFAEVVPANSKDGVTFPLIVPEFLVDAIAVNDEVVYAAFDDQTGIILSRLDGKWSHRIFEDLTVESNIKCGDVASSSVASLNSHTHGYTHGGLSSGSDMTTPPK